MPDFPIVPSKTAMLFFDALNVYLHPKDPAQQAGAEVISTFVRLNEGCRKAGVAIFYGQADHRPDSRDFAAQIIEREIRGHVPGTPFLTKRPAAVSGSWEAEIIPEIAPRPGDYVVTKHRWSTFYETHLELSLRTAGIDTIMIAGGAIEVGVAATAYSGRDRDFNQIIIRDACTSPDPQVAELFMEKVFPLFARVMTVDQVLAAIGAPAHG